jgi:hypothetical protein
MTTQITISDFIASLRKAAANSDSYSEAHRTYFSPAKEDSVLTHRGSACCVSGDLFLQAHESVSDEGIEELVSYINPDEWVAETLGLTDLESRLAFDVNTHHEVHVLLANILEAGMRLPDHSGSVHLSCESTYTAFYSAHVGYCKEALSLEQLKSWMREIAK